MRIAGPVITLICGIMVIVGVFLTWADACSMGYCISFSGWDGISMSISESFNAFLVFIGGILMAVLTLPAFIVSMATKGGRAAVTTLDILAMVGALAAIGGGIWFIIDAAQDHLLGYISYGFYIAFAAAIVGFIFAFLTIAFSKGKQDR